METIVHLKCVSRKLLLLQLLLHYGALYIETGTTAFLSEIYFIREPNETDTARSRSGLERSGSSALSHDGDNDADAEDVDEKATWSRVPRRGLETVGQVGRSRNALRRPTSAQAGVT